MMKSALLFYRKLVSELQEMGFEINPYDPCVANKMVNGTQMMIRWHVDDLMISHLSQDKIMKVVQGMKDIYGENLAETVGTVHDYLGMTFDYYSFFQRSEDQHVGLPRKGDKGIPRRDYRNMRDAG